MGGFCSGQKLKMAISTYKRQNLLRYSRGHEDEGRTDSVIPKSEFVNFTRMVHNGLQYFGEVHAVMRANSSSL